MLSASSLSNIRVVVLGLTGLVCFLYAILALITGHPAPIPPWIPGLFGFGSLAIITLAIMTAGSRNSTMALDEGYCSDSNRAQRIGYWIAVFLYPVFAIPLSQGWVSWEVAFAAMGTLTGAGFLLSFVWFDLRGRA